MTLKLDTLASTLSRVLEAGAVQQAPAVLRACAVDGRLPQLRCAPADADQVSTALRICAEHGAAVIPWGGGTAMHWGNVPKRADVVLSLDKLQGLVEHDDANLTATMQAGMRLAELQEALGRGGQFLAVDPPHPRRATIGGTVAANINGPRRMLYGGIRDLVIGMKMVLASGEAIKAGGKVVKNVAGYDMCKLFVGSLGTLGIITEVTCKMAPLPETAATVVARGSLAQAVQLVDAVLASTLVPAAVALVNGSVAAAGPAAGPVTVAVWAEGFEEGVARHVADARLMAQQAAMAADVLAPDAHRTFWDAVRDFAAGNVPGALFRVTVPIAAVADVLSAVDRMADGHPAQYVAHAGSGTIWLTLDDPGLVGTWFSRLGALARERAGHAVLAAAPPAQKQTLDVWGPPPPSRVLMQELKSQFDPHGMLNPGRFVAGI